LLVLAHPGSPGQRTIKRVFLYGFNFNEHTYVLYYIGAAQDNWYTFRMLLQHKTEAGFTNK